MTIKGYADKKKSNDGRQDFATLNPVREGQFGLDVVAHTFCQEIGTDAAETGSTTRVINATGHTALVGDVISFTSGALDTCEYRVSEVDTDTITTSEEMAFAPSNGDTFSILRQKVPTVGSDGGIAISTVGLATSAKQDTGNTSLASIDTKLTTNRQGRSYADSARLDYTGTNVTTGAWVQLIAATAADINELLIFDSSGQTMELGTGAAASEARKLIIPPGGLSHAVSLRIASGTRVAIRAISGTAIAGEINLTGLN